MYAVALYRLGRGLDERGGLVGRLGSACYWPASRVVETLVGISIPKLAKFGPGLRIHHFGGIVVHADVVVGAECTMRHGVTIGERVDGGPVPRLGDRVDLGAYAQVLGGVRVGDDVSIGAMAVVLADVPSGHVAVGNPARVLERGARQGPPSSGSDR